MNYTDKNILIISHNPLSCVNNNGKTLVSIFEGTANENIYQVYLNSDSPDYCDKCHYLQINEKQIIKSLLKCKNLCCKEVSATPGIVSNAKIQSHVFANHLKRLLREGIWKLPFWKSKLRDWLSDKHFDVVFFMAGDGLFAYDIYRFVMECTKSKGCLFFTDDYMIGKTSRSPIALLRRTLLKRKVKKTLPLIDELYVISDEMKTAYYKLFGIDGYVVRNFSVEKTEIFDKKLDTSRGSDLIMVYAGGLHYNRWRVLAEIATALKEINASHETKCVLKIYSSQNISKDIIEKLNVDGASEFCGGAPASQIAGIYANADILLHVEAFEKKSIASTKYSFSTKIPEYLSAGKCVLAVGPEEVASLCYLSGFACVVNDVNNISSALSQLINDEEYRNMIKSSCEERYNNDFSREKQKECLERILSNS